MTSKRKSPEHDSDYDGAWKEAFHGRLPLLLGKYSPSLGALVDWSHEPEWLDKELSQILGQSQRRNREVDLLFNVRLLTGETPWILIHLEIQTSHEEKFEFRIFRYNCGLTWAFGQQVITLVILADLRDDWLPQEHVYQLADFESRLKFPTCKLIHKLNNEWVDDTSLPVQVARAQIAALRTASDPEGRYLAKWQLVRNLYEAGYNADELRDLFRFIDWMMHLRTDLELLFKQKVHDFEEEIKMPYVTSVERIAGEQGEARGGLKILVRQLARNCGPIPPQVQQRLQSLEIEDLESLADEGVEFRSLPDLTKWLDDHGTNSSRGRGQFATYSLFPSLIEKSLGYLFRFAFGDLPEMLTSRHRLLLYGLVTVAFLTFVTQFQRSTALLAQQPAASEDDGGPSSTAKEPATADDQPADEAPAASTDPNKPKFEKKPINLMQLTIDGGIFMIPLFGLGFLMATFIIERTIGLRRSKVLPTALVEGLGKLGTSKGGFDPRAAYRICQQQPSAAGNVIRAMLLKVGRPHSEVEQTVSQVSEREAERLYYNVRWLNLCASVGPLIGLLGTIQGMILAFHDTANLPPGANKSQVLSEGIYVALVTTFAGLIVAIPSAMWSHFFEGKIQTLFHEIDDLLFNVLPQVERYEGRVRFARGQSESEGGFDGEPAAERTAVVAPK